MNFVFVFQKEALLVKRSLIYSTGEDFHLSYLNIMNFHSRLPGVFTVFFVIAVT